MHTEDALLKNIQIHFEKSPENVLNMVDKTEPDV